MTASDITSMPDDVYAHQLQSTIEGLRYWVPSVIDVAHVAEESDIGYWRLHVTPRPGGGCPFEIVLHDNRTFDVVIADETYEGQHVTALSLFLPLAEAVIEGRVIQRRWFSLSTGALRAVESLVFLADGSVWQAGATADGDSESHDRHFLPYRR